MTNSNAQQLLPGTVTVLLGNGDGTFTPMGASPATGAAPLAIAVGDFNGDGIPDLAVTNRTYNNVTILLGSGDGTFTPTAVSPATGAPYSIAVGDFNGNSIPDLAVGDCDSDTVTILLGNGDGTFTPTSASLATGNCPNSIVAGDFNGDGIPDLAVTNDFSDTVTVLLGNGDGTFTTAPSPATGSLPQSIAMGGFNGDGVPDLVVANACGSGSTCSNGSVTVLQTVTQSATAAIVVVLPAGSATHQVVARYSGDSNYKPGVSVATTLTAAQGTPTVTIAASPNPALYGSSVTLTTTVAGTGLTPTGTMNFYDGASRLGTRTLSSGVATNSTGGFAPGSHSLTVRYAGDINYADVVSAAVILTVNQATPNCTWPAPAPILYPAALSATELDAACIWTDGETVVTVPGTFAYSPAAGAVLYGGKQTLSVTFTPTDATDYTTATATTQLTVNQAAGITSPSPGTTLPAPQ